MILPGTSTRVQVRSRWHVPYIHGVIQFREPRKLLYDVTYDKEVAIRFHQNDDSTFESICRGILPLWNLDFRITVRPLFKQPFNEYYVLDNEHKSAQHLFE